MSNESSSQSKNNEWVPLSDFGPRDDRPLVEVGKTRNLTPKLLLFNNGVAFLVLKHIKKGNIAYEVNTSPYKYARMKPRNGSDFSEEWMYYDESIIHLYPDVVKVTNTEYDGYPVVVFTRHSGEKVRHIVREMKNNFGSYRLVSRYSLNV